MQTNKPTCKV